MKRLFGADGIRGLADEFPLAQDDLERLGRTLGAWLLHDSSSPTCLVGTDTRESSMRIKSSLVDGLTRAGIVVVDAGILPTAAISYLLASKGLFAAGVMVSASHGPIVENGIKVFDTRGVKLNDTIEEAIEGIFFTETMMALPFRMRPSSIIVDRDYMRQYAQSLARDYADLPWQRRHIVVDCAYGAAYQVVPMIFDRLGISHTVHNATPNGININRLAGSEYVRLYPSRFVEQLRQRDAEIGIALDGDADRVLIVDRQGGVYDGDATMAMLMKKLKGDQQLQGNTVVTTQMSNSGLLDYFSQHGVNNQVVRNGDKYVTEAILSQNLTLGGEQVGHVVIRDNNTHVTGDGIRTSLFLLSELTGDLEMTLADMAPGMKKWPQVNVSVHLRRRTKKTVDDIPGLARLADILQQSVTDLTRFECRPASTEPAYRIMIEARETQVQDLVRHALALAHCVQQELGCNELPIDMFDCVRGGLIATDSSDAGPA